MENGAATVMDRALGTQMGDGSLQEVWGALVEGLHHGLGVDHEAEAVGVTQRMCWPKIGSAL